MSLKVKVKEVREKQGIVILSVNGSKCAYLLSRPQPLTDHDTILLKSIIDMNVLDALFKASHSEPHLLMSVHKFFGGLFKIRTYVAMINESGEVINIIEKRAHSFFGHRVGTFIHSHGFEMDVEGQQCVVLTPQELDRIEKGDVND